METKMAIVIRADLGLSCGKAVAQGAHAAVECARLAREKKAAVVRKWHSEGQKKVVLRVPDLQALEELERKARQRGLTTVLIRDAGLTEVPPGTPTALAIGPAAGNNIDPLTGQLPLY
ncbi:MAG: peptidyl-tRNA hydrolase Pth2 [Thermoplasmata archaeon]|nr:peptidyl-tRNA hydrolase Pth2 [Thermoplasmata archaeon]